MFLLFMQQFFQTLMRGVSAENTGDFYRDIDLNTPFSGFDEVTGTHPGELHSLFSTGDNFLTLRKQGGNYASYNQDGTAVLQGGFGDSDIFCGAMLNKTTFVLAPYSPISGMVANLRFNLSVPNNDLALTTAEAPTKTCPITIDLFADEKSIIQAWGSQEALVTRGPFESGTLAVPNARSFKLGPWPSPYGSTYPIQCNDKVCFVSSFDATVGGRTFVGEVRVVNASTPGAYTPIRCTSNPADTENCGKALKIIPNFMPGKTAIAVGWNPKAGGIKLALVYDIEALLKNAAPIVLENYLDGTSGVLFFADASTVSIPTDFGLDAGTLRPNRPTLVIKTPYNPIGAFVVFPEKFSTNATVNLNGLTGGNGFKIIPRNQGPSHPECREAIGESSVFFQNGDCENLVLSNRLPASCTAVTSTTVAYVFDCKHLTDSPSPTPSPLVPTPPSSASSSRSLSRSIPPSQAPSPSVSPPTSSSRQPLFAIPHAKNWTERPEYLVPIVVGASAPLLFLAALCRRKHRAKPNLSAAFFAEGDNPFKESDIKLAKEALGSDSDSPNISSDGSSLGSPIAPKFDIPVAFEADPSAIITAPSVAEKKEKQPIDEPNILLKEIGKALGALPTIAENLNLNTPSVNGQPEIIGVELAPPVNIAEQETPKEKILEKVDYAFSDAPPYTASQPVAGTSPLTPAAVASLSNVTEQEARRRSDSVTLFPKPAKPPERPVYRPASFQVPR